MGCGAIAVAVVLAGCGTSGRQPAGDRVCSATARVATIVHELAAMTDPVGAGRRVQGDLVAIGANLKQITDAEPELVPAYRQQVSTALEAFRSEATAVTGTLLLGERLSVTPSRAKLRAALDGLASKYDATLATLRCD